MVQSGFDFGGMDMGDIFGDIFGDFFGGGRSRGHSDGAYERSEHPYISKDYI